MSVNEGNKNAEALLTEYKVWDLEQNPNGQVMSKEKGFNEPAQIWGETRRVLRDLKLAELAKVLGPEKFPCVTVTTEAGVNGVILTYQTLAAELDCDKVRWISIPAKPTTGGQRKYLGFAKGKVLWRVRVLEGNLKQFLMMRLRTWITSGKYRDDRDGFCKEAAKLVRDYPHKDFDLYKKYIGAICMLMQVKEKSPAFILGVAKQISENLKSALYKEEKEGKDSNEIWLALKEKECIPSVGDCSKNANRALAKFDMDAIKTDEMFDSLEQKAKEEAEASEKALMAAFEEEDDSPADRGVKREREEGTDDNEGQGDSKIAKLEK